MGENSNTTKIVMDDLAKRLGISLEELKLFLTHKTYRYGGDFSITKALKDAKAEGISLDAAAEKIKKQLESSPFISKIEITKGYVNCWYNYKNLFNLILNTMNEGYGGTEYGKGERIIIEHTSVNPNKAIHIGHLRNAAIGDSLSKLLKNTGYEVIVTTYTDDTGAQVADNIVGIKFLGMPAEEKGMKLDHYFGDKVYIKVNESYKTNPSLLEKRSVILKAIENRDKEISKLVEDMVEKVLRAQLETMWRFGVFYDLINYESHILAYKFWDNAFNLLKEKGEIKIENEGEKKGCWVFQKADGEKKIIVRSDGTVVYAGKDIAYAMWKHGLMEGDFKYRRWITQSNGKTLWTTTLDDSKTESHPKFNDVDRSINIIDITQSYEQEVVKEVIDKLSGGKAHYIHYEYAVVALSPETAKKLGVKEEDKDFFRMSGRKGIYINADDLIDRLKQVILQETKSRNKDLSEEECEKIAESLSISTLRYEMVRTDPKKILVFDMDEALRLESKGAIYIEYTLSRMSGILRNAAEKIEDVSYKEELTDQEKKLLLDIFLFPDIVESAARDLNLTAVSNFASEFSSDFNEFYRDNSVIKSEGEERKFRLWLVNASRTVLKNASEILGIIPLDRM
ncbi:MAG: arginine--tRNA ligase [Candidatus Acidifodinimicrobium sp.]